MAELSEVELKIYEMFKPICREIDIDNIGLKKEFRRKVLSASRFPLGAVRLVNKTDKYKIYLSYFARKRGDHNRPNIARFGIFETKYGKYAIIWTYPSFYTIFKPHMFDRYEERMLKNNKFDREHLIIKYITSESGHIVLKMNDKIEEVYHCFEGHYDKEGLNYVAANNIGYLFGDIHDDGRLSIIRTIITEDMLSENQRKLFPRIKDVYNNQQNSFYESLSNNDIKPIRYIE
ncbi:MAG: hypothetical protein II235_09125 [Muribaculaceae bacterium]|nr:hypothetical protein [Muribaculaceae bacterium]